MTTTRNIRIVDAFAATDVGMRRDNNEDAVISNPQCGIFLVADGMGGHPGGEIASTIAAQTAHDYFVKSTGVDPRSALRGAFNAADAAVRSHGRSNPRFFGMGTTLVAIAIRGDRMWVAHCGDSRAYSYHVTLSRLTNDHGNGNVISRAIGCVYGSGPDINTMRLYKGDVLMLCSDGLHAYVDGNLIAQELSDVKSCKKTCAALIGHAMEAGAPDNVTVVVVKMG